MLLRATRGHHGRLIAATAVIQVTLMIGMHWQVLPDAMRGVPAQREASSYVLYLIGGSVVACHVITEYATGGPAGAITGAGWLDTGDLGYLDEDGYLFLAGRTDDVINRGGEKIYPREIEGSAAGAAGGGGRGRGRGSGRGARRRPAAATAGRQHASG